MMYKGETDLTNRTLLHSALAYYHRRVRSLPRIRLS